MYVIMDHVFMLYLVQSAWSQEGLLMKGLGKVLLGIWLIITGIQPFINFAIPSQSELMAILALVAGILIILER